MITMLSLSAKMSVLKISTKSDNMSFSYPATSTCSRRLEKDYTKNCKNPIVIQSTKQEKFTFYMKAKLKLTKKSILNKSNNIVLELRCKPVSGVKVRCLCSTKSQHLIQSRPLNTGIQAAPTRIF